MQIRRRIVLDKPLRSDRRAGKCTVSAINATVDNTDAQIQVR